MTLDLPAVEAAFDARWAQVRQARAFLTARPEATVVELWRHCRFLTLAEARDWHARLRSRRRHAGGAVAARADEREGARDACP